MLLSLASQISLISPLHFSMNRNLFLTIVIGPGKKRPTVYAHTHTEPPMICLALLFLHT